MARTRVDRERFSARNRTSCIGDAVSGHGVAGHREPGGAPSREIVIRGGEVVTIVAGRQVRSDNHREFILDLARMHCRLARPKDVHSGGACAERNDRGLRCKRRFSPKPRVA